VVVDHVSISGSQDQGFSVDKGAHDVTLQYSIVGDSYNPRGGTRLPVLIAANTQHISLHHNLIHDGYERLPKVVYSNGSGQSPGTQVDMRNNILWDWSSYGTMLWGGTRANVVGNYYYDPNADAAGQKRAISTCSSNCSNSTLKAQSYIAGNASGAGAAVSNHLNSLGSTSKPFAAAGVTTTDACTGAVQVLANAGARRGGLDQTYLGKIKLQGCSAGVIAASAQSVSHTCEP
jgi:hypothetical protein